MKATGPFFYLPIIPQSTESPLNGDLLSIVLFRQLRLRSGHGNALRAPCRAFDRSSATLSRRPRRRSDCGDAGQLINEGALGFRPPRRCVGVCAARREGGDRHTLGRVFGLGKIRIEVRSVEYRT